MLEALGWSLATLDAEHLVLRLFRAIVVGLLLYQGDYFFIAIVEAIRRLRGLDRRAPRLREPERWDVAVVLPTLLRNAEDRRGLERAIGSVIENGYPGRVVIVAAIDERAAHPTLVRALQRWAEALTLPTGVSVWITGSEERVGKAVATAHAIEWLQARVEEGTLARFPPILFSMDADSHLAPATLERMVVALIRRNPITGRRGRIVASNVVVPPEHYGRGRALLSPQGLIALSVAREYLQSISLAKHDLRLVPTLGVSGALYGTWSDVHVQAPAFVTRIRTLRLREVIGFWLGRPIRPIRGLVPRPETLTGPADDTCMTWVALLAVDRGDRWRLELPSSPLEALAGIVETWIFRGMRYDPRAKVYTKTPTAPRALFVQRKRWNGSRPYNFNRFGYALLLQPGLGLAATWDVALLFAINATHVVTLAVLPFVPISSPSWNAVIAGFVLTMVVRGSATALGLFVSGEPRAWRTLLAVPLAHPFHLIFNVVTTLVTWVEDVLLFGAKTNFAPDTTLERSTTSRLALAYRMRRALGLALRALRYGDVPFGAFWFGWYRTRYTSNGYAGWTSRPAPPVVLPSPRARPR